MYNKYLFQMSNASSLFSQLLTDTTPVPIVETNREWGAGVVYAV